MGHHPSLGAFVAGKKLSIQPGDKFNRWTAMHAETSNRTGMSRWRFRCICGNERIVTVSSVKNGTSKSCGCLRAETRCPINPGDKFNRLTAVRQAARPGGGYWHFNCDCGKNDHIAKLYEVRSGDIKSCGCLRREKRVYDPIASGDKFGLLTAIRSIGIVRPGRMYWLFKCDCGTDYLGRAHAVQSGKIRSCGCRGLIPYRCTKCGEQKPPTEFSLRKNGLTEKQCKDCVRHRSLAYFNVRFNNDPEFAERHKLSSFKSRANPYTRIGVIYRSLKHNALARGISFNLSKDDITSIAEKQEWKCAKTGVQLDLTMGAGQLPFGPTIDRIENSRGYDPENIQLVCYMYNIAKNRFTDEDVLTFAKSLVEYQRDKNLRGAA